MLLQGLHMCQAACHTLMPGCSTAGNLRSCWLVIWLCSCDIGGPCVRLVASSKISCPSESVKLRSKPSGAGVPSRQPLLNAHVNLWDPLQPPCDAAASDICEKFSCIAMAPALGTWAPSQPCTL